MHLPHGSSGRRRAYPALFPLLPLLPPGTLGQIVHAARVRAYGFFLLSWGTARGTLVFMSVLGANETLEATAPALLVCYGWQRFAARWLRRDAVPSGCASVSRYSRYMPLDALA